MACNSRPRSKHRERKKFKKNAKTRLAAREKHDYQPRGPSLGQTIDSVVPVFRAFYSLSGIDLDERDWNRMIRSLRNNLPISFRLVSPPRRLPAALESLTQYIPAVDAYSLTVDSKTLKRDHPDVIAWLIEQTQSHAIIRQEIVSMLPVSLILPSSKCSANLSVLDLCASPGSKTSQAAQLAAFVVANELSQSRSHTLAHRARNKNVAVVNHKAQTIPDVYKFDRVICDVPCSGDGTFRKYPDKWAKWEPSVGRQLHSLQIQIALRGARLLKKGGLMAYSTCSLNPLENEAVVQAILNRTGDAFEVVQKEIGNFITRPGLTTWSIISDDLDEMKTESNRLRKSMLPVQDKKYEKHLKNCIRVYPHDNDTGGFFIAVLRKLKDWPAAANEDVSHNPLIKKPYSLQDSVLKFTDGSKNDFELSADLADFMAGPGKYFNIISAGSVQH